MTPEDRLAALIVRHRELLSYMEGAESRSVRKRCIVSDPDGIDAIVAQGASYQHDLMVARGMVRDAISEAEDRPSSPGTARVLERMDALIEQARESERQTLATRRVT